MVIGKEFRVGLVHGKKKQRIVAPFSMQSLQPNTKVYPPPRCHVFRERKITNSLFRKYFLRGDIPICRANQKQKNTNAVLMWRIKPEELDYTYYLPIFFDGLCESEYPFKEFARRGVHDLLEVGGDKVLPCIPQLIIPIKNGLNTRNPDVIIATLRAVQHLLLTGPYVGRALVPYFRQLLSVLNLFRDVNVNIGDKIDFNPIGNVGDLVEETLQMLEKCGGPDAFINIKYMVPTYESCVLN